MTSHSNTCPQCGKGQLYFSGDGRARECERCGHRLPLTGQRRLMQTLEDLASYRIANERADEYGRAGIRLLLAQGIAAAKEGDLDEATHYLGRVLRTNAEDADKARAWLWLSQTLDEPAEKRYCLEQVLVLDPTHGTARRGLAVLDGRINPHDIINPDQLHQEISDEPLAVNVEQFTCPRCAGHMNYTPDGRALICEFCLYQQYVAANGRPSTDDRFGQGAFEQEFTLAMATAQGHVQPIQIRAFHCHNCAVEFVLAPQTISVTCPYCEAVYVTETAESREIIPPHALIPFAISQDNALTRLRAWFKQHNIERPRLSPIIGIYIPVWTFDLGGEIKWNGLVKRGDDWLPITGSHLPFYDDILVSAAPKTSEIVGTAMTEFDLRGLAAYDPRYLADWPAERYQLPLSDASLIARKKVLKDLRRNTHRLTHGEIVRDLRLNSTGLIIESFKHILLPLWIAHYKFEDRLYDVVVNGQNGRVYGTRPQGSLSKFFSRLLGKE
jgi:tetratricopeptide (TPR) repeat protein